MDELGGNSYFKAVVNDAVHEVLNKGVGYCFQQEQVDTITDILHKQHKIKKVYVDIVDGIFYIYKHNHKESAVQYEQ